MQNVDLSGDPAIDHLNIDTTPSLQQQTLNYVLQAMFAPGAASAGDAPAVSAEIKLSRA